MFYLLKFCEDYADEFDVHGFKIIDEEQKVALEALLEHIEDARFIYYFGTNEEVEYNPYHLLNEARALTPAQYHNLELLFGSEWGNFPNLEEDIVDTYTRVTGESLNEEELDEIFG